MKKAIFAFIAVALFSSCPNPVLKWINMPFEQERLAANSGDKEIISFSFGLGSDVENDLPITQILDATGQNPVSVILYGDISRSKLRPEIRFIGESISPQPGEVKDFRASVDSPVVYTVTAKDGTTRDYGARVYLQNEHSKEIVRFALDIGQGLTAEGTINQKAETITVSVPAGTDMGNLGAHIVHTGQTLEDSEGRSYTENAVNMSDDFSAPEPGKWTVTARDGGTKTYTVTVYKEKSDARAITKFSFGLPGEEDIIGAEPQPDGKYPILVVLPNVDSGTLSGKAPEIVKTGVSVSPEDDDTTLFSNPLAPVTYTVAAENGSARDYVVRVISRNAAGDNEAIITGFYFTDPLAQGIIDQTTAGTPGTITLAVPMGTDLWALRPEVYYKGEAVSPLSGQPQNFDGTSVRYTVRAHNKTTTKAYNVSVSSTIRIPPTVTTGTETADVSIGTDTSITPSANFIIVNFPVHIGDQNITINYPGWSQTITINPDSVFPSVPLPTITVTNITEKVIIINPPATPPAPPVGSTASIDYFFFADPAAIGTIGSGTGTVGSPIPITVTVPYGTDLRNLKATVIYTGKEIVGIPGPSPLKDGSRSFYNPVDYVVKAEDGTPKYYQVTVTVADNNASDITAFSFAGIPDATVLISGAPNNVGKYPIEITVPQGTNIDSLIPVITHTGASISGSGITSSPPNPGTVTGSANNFSTSDVTPIEYKVTAEDIISTKTYAVTVKVEPPDDVEITGFYFTDPLAVGKINQSANLITVTVPSGTNRGSLMPTVYFEGMSLNPASGVARDFTNVAAYTVTGVSGITRTYSVVVNSTPSSSKDITRFKLSGVVNSGLVIGGVPDADGLYPISIEVPDGTNLASLGTEISHTGASIGPAAGTPLNFSNPQNYTVTAEDGSVKTYKVMVHAENSAKLITSLIFNAVPLSGGGSVRVVAAIDQGGRIITAAVPHTADISGLTPVITYIGKSITLPGGSSDIANPFTDTGRDFSKSQTYTVAAQDDTTAVYTVTVIRKSGFTVRFEGEAERKVINANTFDQATGIVTVTIDTGQVDGPYSWYVDGVKQGASGSTFTLNVGNGSLYPGRYEIMAEGRKNGLRYTGKVYCVVAGGL